MEHYTYKRKCECCGEIIEYCSLKKSHHDYDRFLNTMLTGPAQQFLHCEKCDMQTLQTLVAYEGQ